MSASGGATTQSGILYQNSVSALYLGRMCDAAQRPDCERVHAVRVEAPGDVDDIVVRFADEHCAFIQVKESVSVGHEPWRRLWRDFDAQFRQTDFRRGRDRLILYVGEAREEQRDLKGACLRAGGGMSYGEWLGGLNEKQKVLVEKIKPQLSPETLEDSNLLALFTHIDVELWSLVEIERDKVYYWMPPTDSGKLPIEIFRLLRDRVGGEARRRGTFTLDSLRESLATEGCRLAIPSDISSLREAVARCGAILRQHKHTIARTGRHILRDEVDPILAWALSDVSQEPLAMFLDRAGMGKSVVIRDVLVGLEEAGVVVLAIKADQQLSGVDSHGDLQAALGLPEPVERVIGRLAALGSVVVLVDQIDALSLSLARDQKALDVVLEMVARLRLIPGVRILISCRAFDRNGDPRLRNIEVKKEFALAELPDAQVESVLRPMGIEYDHLSPATRKLLRVPLHLDLFARAVEVQGARSRGPEVYRGIGSLQDLYALVWEHVILQPGPDAPPSHERLEVLDQMTDRMFRDQRTTVPRSMFATAETLRLERAVRWLASEGILVAGPTELGLLHQTFFDYCYARRFVEAGRSLVEAILASDQELQVRPMLVQVLSYLRGSDPRSYLAELRVLFDAEGLRFHLRDLLVRWFGSLPEPNDGEWSLAYRRLVDPATRARFLAAMGGNAGWFARIDGEPLEMLLGIDEQSVDGQVIPYLIFMLEEEQADVVKIARRLSDRGGAWLIRAAQITSTIRDWRLPEAAELFERLACRLDTFLHNEVYQLEEIAKVHPQVGCRLIRRLLEFALESHVAKREEGGRNFPHSLGGELDHFTNSGRLDEALKTTSQADPEYFIESLLSWLEVAVRRTGGTTNGYDYFASDGLCRSWYDQLYHVQDVLIQAFMTVLGGVAREVPQVFRHSASRLASLPYRTPQMLLAKVYQSVPDVLASDALNFLLDDRRRLNLGEIAHYESRQLIKAIHPFLSGDERSRLENFIIDNPHPHKNLGLYGLRTRGLDQLYLLQAIPIDHMTERGLSYLGELERKFPETKVSDDPKTIYSSWVGSPISQEATAKMSDRAWLRAMRKYRRGVAHRDPFKGGHRELGRVLFESVKAAPERFYQLVGRAPDSTVGPYAWAFINGIAESDAPAEWLFNLARRFVNFSDADGRRVIAWALRRRVESGLPDDLMDILECWVRDPALDTRNERNDNPHMGYINSDRGNALQTLARALDRRESHDASGRKWGLIEFVAADSSTTLRAGAIEELLYMLHEDRTRAIYLFERLMQGHPTLLRSPLTQQFLYHGFYKNFNRLALYIRGLMDEPADEHSQRGAELACIAAISPLAIESEEAYAAALRLAAEANTGPKSWRRGAARVYAVNLHQGSSEECLSGLTRLFDDEDEGARNLVSGLFSKLRGEHLITRRDVLSAFASSRSLAQGMRAFSKYLWEYGLLEPATTLSLITTALDNSHDARSLFNYSAGEELIRVVLRIYADPGSTDAIHRASMDVFDKLMERYAGSAYRVLEEWDRV